MDSLACFSRTHSASPYGRCTPIYIVITIAVITALVVGILAWMQQGPFAAYAYSEYVAGCILAFAGFLVLCVVTYKCCIEQKQFYAYCNLASSAETRKAETQKSMETIKSEPATQEHIKFIKEKLGIDAEVELPLSFVRLVRYPSDDAAFKKILSQVKGSIVTLFITQKGEFILAMRYSHLSRYRERNLVLVKHNDDLVIQIRDFSSGEQIGNNYKSSEENRSKFFSSAKKTLIDRARGKKVSTKI